MPIDDWNDPATKAYFEAERHPRELNDERVPVGDVAAWLDENYGTPDADRFLAAFQPKALSGGPE